MQERVQEIVKKALSKLEVCNRELHLLRKGLQLFAKKEADRKCHGTGNGLDKETIVKNSTLQKACGILLLITVLSACSSDSGSNSDPTAERTVERSEPDEVVKVGRTDIEGVVGLNYYIDEADADIYFDIGPGNTVADWIIQARVAGEVFERAIDSAGEHILSVPLSSLLQGSHDVELAVLDSGNNAKWSGLDRLVIRHSPADSATRITQVDRHKRIMLVDGEPFFPIGIYGVNNDVNKAGVNNLDLVHESGFNVTMRWRKKIAELYYDPAASMLENQTVVHDYLDAVHAAGLLAFEAPVNLTNYYHFDDDNDSWNQKWREINSYVVPGVVGLARSHPAVIGYFSYRHPENEYPVSADDEPKLMQEGVENFYQTVKAADPYHPVLAQFEDGLGESWDWTAWDVPAGQFDLQEKSHMSQVYRSVRDASLVAEAMNQPFIATPLFEKSVTRSKPLNGEEQRAQTYLSLIGGAKGLLYWEWPAAYDDNWTAIQRLVAEINELKPVLLEPDPEQYYDYSHYGTENSVRALVKNHGNDTYLIIANAENAEVDVNYELPSRYNAEAENIFDNGFVYFEDGRFNETLPPYARRVYKFTGITWEDGESIAFDITVGPTQALANPIFSDNPSYNYVKNGSFAHSYGSAPGWPAFWGAHASILDSGETGTPGGRWVIDPDVSYLGGQSMRLEKHFEGDATDQNLYNYGHAPNLAQDVALPAGDYTISFYAKAETTKDSFWVWLGNSLKNRLKFCTSTPCGWEKVELDYSTDVATNLNLRIVLRTQGKLWIDAVQVQRAGTDPGFVEEGPLADTVPPETPAAPQSSKATDTEVYIDWLPSSDNAGVIKEYQIYNDGTLVATTNLLMHKLVGLTPRSSYSIQVKAIDLGGNISEFSDPLAVMTTPSPDDGNAPAPSSVNSSFRHPSFFREVM